MRCACPLLFPSMQPAHRASVLTCTQCHADMELPEGWISAQEAKLLPNQA